MATLQDYQTKVLTAHPELVGEFLKSDIEIAQTKLNEAQYELDELKYIESELNPVPTPAALVEPTGQVPDTSVNVNQG